MLFWIVFGGLAGWIAAMIEEGLNGKQTLAYITLGIIGAFVGGGIIQLFSSSAPIRIGLGNLIFPTLGAVVLLYIATQARKQS
jgi:uncharacterized membrane protein YeaQ/YmgE (transglycosylase-associated protein family)